MSNISMLERVNLKTDSTPDALTTALISLGIRPYSRESVKKYQTMALMNLKKDLKEDLTAISSMLDDEMDKCKNNIEDEFESVKREYPDKEQLEMYFEIRLSFLEYLEARKRSLERRHPKVQWRRAYYDLEELQKLKVFIPLSVKNMVSDIHKCLPYTDLFVEYLDEMEEEINWEPFLIAVDDENKNHEEYIKVWDEPKFEEKRLN